MPNHRMKTGMNAIFGAGKPSETSGSNSQCSARLRAIAMPRVTPAAVASARPAKVRARLTARSIGSDPSAVSAAMRDATALTDGKNNGGASSSRAAASHAMSTAPTETSARALPAIHRRVMPAASATLRLPCAGLVPAQADGAEPEQRAVGQERAQHDARDRREHVIVGAVLAVHEGEPADPGRRGDHLGRDRDHEGEAERD